MRFNINNVQGIFSRHSLYLIASLLLLFSFSCASGRLHLKETAEKTEINHLPDFTIYALGDAGALNDQSKSVVKALSQAVSDDMQPGLVIYLGDNVYPSGLAPESNEYENKYGQDVLINQTQSLKDYKGEIIFIPGNHDWNEGRSGGLDAMKRQGDFINGLNDPHIKLIPANGCGDPHAIEVTPQTVMIIFDSQWWIQDWEKEPGINKGCQISSRPEFISAIKQLIEAHKDKQILVAMHHPLYSQGTHGGHFPWRDHIFPLTRVVNWLYVPLPVIGSIYPGYRSIFGHTQDTRGPRYKALKEEILNSIGGMENVIFLSGHDHNLQYTRRDGHHHLISGSGSKLNRVSDSRYLRYGHMAPGFMQLDVYDHLGIRLSVYEIAPGSDIPRVVFSDFIVKN